MSIGAISNLAGGYLQNILSTTLQKATSQTGALGSLSASSLQSQTDNGQLSPFAQILATLQQLQQSNPSQYQQVTQQISSNLKTAAQTAQSQGNTAAANELNQLATDFGNASQSGQLPNIQDLSQAIGGGHHHHHHHFSGSSSSNSNNNSNQSLDQLLSAFQSNSTQNSSLDPANIILNTLSSAGLGPAAG